MTHSRTTLRTGLIAALTTVLVALALSPAAIAQGKRKKWKGPKYRFDEYTRMEPEAMRKAGYVSFGPFAYGEQGAKLIKNTTVDQHLSYAQFRWVETKHFRIGSSLIAYSIPNELSTKKKFRAELEKLATKIPRVKKKIKTRIIDPWLRLHLYAQRMEELYEDIQSWLGVTDEDFPINQAAKKWGAPYMGEGRYMGMAHKYMLLVTNKKNTYLDYLKNFTGQQTQFGQRWHYTREGCLFYGIAFGMLDDKHDFALHNDLIFNVTINIIDGFRHYSYDLPVWIREGLGHWFQRQNSPKWNSFDQDEAAPMDPPSKWRWKPYVRQLLLGKKWSKFSKVIQWRHYGEINFVDHVMLWARTDFLMSKGKKKFREFMFQIKGRIDPKTQLSDHKDLVGAVRDAMKKTYGLTPLNFDAKFKEWAEATYPIR